MVNTVSSQYPFGAAHCEYDPADIRPGIWNVHATEDYDHFQFIGGMHAVRPVSIRAFYKALMDDIARTVPEAAAVQALEAPRIWYGGKSLLGNVTLNWYPVKGAGCYEIYRSDAENGTYVKIGSALGSAYTDFTAARKTVYYYKLTAVPYAPGLVTSEYSAAYRVK